MTINKKNIKIFGRYTHSTHLQCWKLFKLCERKHGTIEESAYTTSIRYSHTFMYQISLAYFVVAFTC